MLQIIHRLLSVSFILLSVLWYQKDAQLLFLPTPLAMQAGAAEFLGGSQTHLVPWNTLPPVNAKAFHHLPTRQSLIIGSPLRPHIPHLLPINLS